MDLRDIDSKFAPIDKSQIEYWEKILKDVNPKSSIKLIDLTERFRAEMLDSINLKNHFTPYAMLRLFADDLEEIPDKILYLDTDTIINNDLSELYNIDIEDYELACVKDVYNWASPSRWKIKNYFNSGVMLLNMKNIRQTGYLKKVRKMVHDKRMLYPDQDALNKCVTKKLVLPTKFNSKDKYYPEIVVHHFCNVRKHFFHRIKPWEVELVKEKMSAYDDILDDYTKRMKELKAV